MYGTMRLRSVRVLVPPGVPPGATKCRFLMVFKRKLGRVNVSYRTVPVVLISQGGTGLIRQGASAGGGRYARGLSCG